MGEPLEQEIDLGMEVISIPREAEWYPLLVAVVCSRWDIVVNHRRSADMQPLLPPVGICEKSVGGFTGVKCSIKDAKRGERGVK